MTRQMCKADIKVLHAQSRGNARSLSTGKNKTWNSCKYCEMLACCPWTSKGEERSRGREAGKRRTIPVYSVCNSREEQISPSKFPDSLTVVFSSWNTSCAVNKPRKKCTYAILMWLASTSGQLSSTSGWHNTLLLRAQTMLLCCCCTLDWVLFRLDDQLVVLMLRWMGGEGGFITPH